MMEEGVDVEAFYVCDCKSRSTVPRGSPRLTNLRQKWGMLYGTVMNSSNFLAQENHIIHVGLDIVKKQARQLTWWLCGKGIYADSG